MMFYGVPSQTTDDATLVSHVANLILLGTSGVRTSRLVVSVEVSRY